MGLTFAVLGRPATAAFVHPQGASHGLPTPTEWGQVPPHLHP